MPDAIIFVPPDSASRPWLVIDAQYSTRKGYRVVAVASDWAAVWRMLADGDAQVVVIGRREHAPWLEIVTDPAPEEPLDTRRPRRT